MVENTFAKTESSPFSLVFISSLIDGEKGFVNFSFVHHFLGIAHIFVSMKSSILLGRNVGIPGVRITFVCLVCRLLLPYLPYIYIPWLDIWHQLVVGCMEEDTDDCLITCIHPGLSHSRPLNQTKPLKVNFFPTKVNTTQVWIHIKRLCSRQFGPLVSDPANWAPHF